VRAGSCLGGVLETENENERSKVRGEMMPSSRAAVEESSPAGMIEGEAAEKEREEYRFNLGTLSSIPTFGVNG